VRLPWSKVYRAFPELDQFDDRRCEEFVRSARRRFRHEFAPRLLLQVLVTALCVIIAAGISGRWMAFADVRLAPVAATVPCAVLLGCSLLPAVLIRDLWLRSMLRRHIGNARCQGCGYPLLGLPVMGEAKMPGVRCPECGESAGMAIGLCRRCGNALEGLPAARAGTAGSVRCPECGKTTHLDEHGLTAADLLSDQPTG
jgi:DNA-directed RNA polymerase subunit RPC12/RpoP